MGLRITPTEEQLKKKKKPFKIEVYPNVIVERELFKRYRENPNKLKDKELLILIFAELRDIRTLLEEKK